MLRSRTVVHVILVLLSAEFSFASEPAALPQPGPENGGLRLRFMVDTRRADSVDEFQVRLDLINVTKTPIKLSADWPNHLKGDFREYMEGAASMLTHPDITLWGIQVMATRQSAPRAEYTLASGEVFTVEWATRGRRLKNRVIHPNSNRNPYFPSTGLYGVHAELLLNVETKTVDGKWEVPSNIEEQPGRQPVLLRSNEQLVSVGGSNHAPKTAIAVVQDVSEDFTTGHIAIGTVEGIQPGDQFLARTGMSALWKLTVTETYVGYSKVLVKRDAFGSIPSAPPRSHERLKPGNSTGLIPAGVEGMGWMWAH